MLCALLTLSVSMGAIHSSLAGAALVTTEALLNVEPHPSSSSRSQDRDTLHARLVAMGVQPALARERVNMLTDDEVARLVAHMDRLPAGADTTVGAVIFIFLVLLATDILGYTDVYPFITRTVNGDKCTD